MLFLLPSSNGAVPIEKLPRQYTFLLVLDWVVIDVAYLTLTAINAFGFQGCLMTNSLQRTFWHYFPIKLQTILTLFKRSRMTYCLNFPQWVYQLNKPWHLIGILEKEKH